MSTSWNESVDMVMPISSSRKVQYNLRPLKQIERRMMGHTFQMFAEAGFPISTYRYAGFGAFFFVDFILFRMMLSIRDMISIEHDISHRKRVEFKRPFKDIHIAFEESSNYLAQISPDVPHILWLDYDGPIRESCIQDIQMAAARLKSSSILIVTFDIDFDKADGPRNLPPGERQTAWLGHFERECSIYFNPELNQKDFASMHIWKRTTEVVDAAIQFGIQSREKLIFEPLFSFQYADGHKMLTLGGMIADEGNRNTLRKIDWDQLPFIRRNFCESPFTIECPVLTRKEKLYLDSEMPCESDWFPQDFLLSQEELDQYKKVHKYYPSYAELLL